MKDQTNGEVTEKEVEPKSINASKSIALIKANWAKFQNFTTKEASDNLWIIGFKLFLKGIMVLILILLSPLILTILIFSFLVAI